MNELVKWRPNAEVDRRIEEAMEMIAASQRPPTARSHSRQPATQAQALTVALPRVCGIRDLPWAAYYEPGANGRYRHSQSGIVNKQVYRASFCGTRTAVRLRYDDVEDEMCPYCGTSGPPIYCRSCRNWVCRGRVIDNYFKCTGSCRAHGNLVRCTDDQEGVVLAAGGPED